MLQDNLDDLTVSGYIFSTHDDAEIARNEIKKIAYIESRMDMTNMTVVYGIYNKALENRTFQTPVGLEFMHKLHDLLVSSGMKEEIKPIPLFTTFRRIDLSESNKPVRRVITQKEREEQKIRVKYRNSVLISTILFIMVIVLFIITYTGSTPNILNYKTAITNEYAEWEADLSKREAEVREKERELNINGGN